MPTAGRLAAALAFFIYGWYIGILAGPLFPESSPPSFLIPLSIAIAIACGWMIVGSRAGRGYAAAIGNGLTGAFAYTLWMLFLIAFEDMIQRSLRRSYDGPMEAVVSVFDLMFELSSDLFNLQLIVSVVVGGVVCSLISEYFAKRYP